MILPRPATVVTHVISWLLFFSLIISFDSLGSGNRQPFTALFSLSYLIFYAVYLFIFYFNLVVLVPQLYLQRRYMLYIASIVLLLLGVYLTQPFDRIYNNHRNEPAFAGRPGPRFGDHPPPRQEQQPPLLPPGEENGDPYRPAAGRQHIDIVSIVLFFMIWSLSTAIQIIRQWRITERRAAQAEAGKANAELSFLKAQINPHFLFNTLNNIYSLAVTGSPHTPGAILKLSGMMRYMTDEASQDFVSLEDEIECISNYIDLQRIRLNTQVSINFSVSGHAPGKEIAPLVLMTFIENVFKYGISSHDPSEIIIKLFTGEQSVDFFCQNKIFSKQKAGRTGIGISNTRKRLEHLYPSRHTLSIISKDDLYTVHLSLQL